MLRKHLLLLHLCCFWSAATRAAWTPIKTDVEFTNAMSTKSRFPVSHSDDKKKGDSHHAFAFNLAPVSSLLKRLRKITKRPTNTIHCKIFCRSGYHLQILPGGSVRGTVDQGSKYALFEMQSFGPSLVKLMNPATGKYLAMKRDGSVLGVLSRSNRETLFKETHEQNAFHSYASHKYYRSQPHDMLVGIKKNGRVKPAKKTLHGQTATQFLVIKFT